MAAVLLSLHNPDLSRRKFPLLLGANLPELDVPAWWHLGRKQAMYYDGRTDACSVRANMQFLLGEESLQELKDLRISWGGSEGTPRRGGEKPQINPMPSWGRTEIGG